MKEVHDQNFACCTTILLGCIPSALPAKLDTGRVDELTGLKGKMNEKEGVYKFVEAKRHEAIR